MLSAHIHLDICVADVIVGAPHIAPLGVGRLFCKGIPLFNVSQKRLAFRLLIDLPAIIAALHRDHPAESTFKFPGLFVGVPALRQLTDPLRNRFPVKRCLIALQTNKSADHIFIHYLAFRAELVGNLRPQPVIQLFRKRCHFLRFRGDSGSQVAACLL